MNDVIIQKPTPALIKKISKQLQTEGFYCLNNAIDKKALKIFQAEIMNLIKIKGKRYFSLSYPYTDSNSPFSIFQKSKKLHTFLYELAKKSINKDVSNFNIYNVLRVVTGKKTDSQSLKFHYDAEVITLLVPILIPSGPLKKSGHLITFKNNRKIRRFAIFNIIEKLIFQNFIFKRICSYIVLNDLKKYTQILNEGNIYIFNGYRTFHANLPVDANYVRATLMFHCGNPHNNSLLIKSIVNFRDWRERLNANKKF